MINEVDTFLATLLKEVKSVGIDLGDLKIDHLAYTTSSAEEYENLLPEFLETGKLARETIISDRRVAVIELNSPIKYNDYIIAVVELIEPIKGEDTKSCWEHAEFLVSNYEDILAKYPTLEWNTNHKDRHNFSRIKLALPNGMEVKFLDTPVLVSIKKES